MPVAREHTLRVSRATRIVLALLVGCLIACGESPTVVRDAPVFTPTTVLSRVQCTADVRAQMVACATDAPSASAASGTSRSLIIGNQNVFVTLTSSNIIYSGNVFAFDVTVKNLIGQKLGTTNGITVDPAGVRVFFQTLPAGAGGTIDFVDPANGSSMVNGTATYTASNQPYYQYPQIVGPGLTSSTNRWRIHVPATVPAFNFTVYVAAEVQFPLGYVTFSQSSANLEATQTASPIATVRDALGRVLGSEVVTWGTSAAGVATVNASGVVTAVSIGNATITATSTTSGARTGTVAIVVVPTPVAAVNNSGAVVSFAVGGTLGAPLYPSVRFNDGSGNAVPNALNASTTFTVTGGACTVTAGSVSVPVDASGLASLTSSNLTIPATAGSCTVHAVTTPSLTGSPLDYHIVIAPVAGSTWLGGASNNAGDPANWRNAVVPGAASAVFVAKNVAFAPSVPSAATVASLTLEPGAAVNLSGFALTVSGDVDAGTVAAGGGLSNGQLILTNTTSANLQGPLPTITVGPAACAAGVYSLTGASTAASVTLNCRLNIGANSLTTLAAGNLTTQNSGGKLAMTVAGGSVLVSGNAVFNGADETGLLTQGTLEVLGNFTQSNTISTSSFHATGTTVRLTGTSVQTLSFSNPATSYFSDLVTASTGGLTFSTGVTVNNSFSVSNKLTIAAATTTKALGTTSFNGGAATVVTGALQLAPTNFYSLSSTTGAGTLTTTGPCARGTNVTSINVTGGAGFTQATCQAVPSLP
jgi:hypothetical protein